MGATTIPIANLPLPVWIGSGLLAYLCQAGQHLMLETQS
jgi:hypothetical protein